MPVNLPPDFMEIAFHHLGGSVTGEMVNTLAVDVTGMVGDNVQAGLDGISQAWADGPQAAHCTGISYVKATAIYNSAVFGKTALESRVGAIGGSASPPMMPLNVAIIVQKTTAFAGRKFRGRLFFGAFPAGVMSSANPNVLSSSFHTSFQATWTTFQATLTSLGFVPVLLHQTSYSGPPTPISSFDVHDLVGSIRMRIR
jgi:hypothetical protein